MRPGRKRREARRGREAQPRRASGRDVSSCRFLLMRVERVAWYTPGGAACRARRQYQNRAKTSIFPAFDLPILRLARSPKGPTPAARGLEDHETRRKGPSHVSVRSMFLAGIGSSVRKKVG